MRFRIISNGSHFRVQYKEFIFWATYSYETERGTHCYHSFNTEKEAEVFIRQKKESIGMDCEEWTVVKEL